MKAMDTTLTDNASNECQKHSTWDIWHGCIFHLWSTNDYILYL